MRYIFKSLIFCTELTNDCALWTYLWNTISSAWSSFRPLHKHMLCGSLRHFTMAFLTKESNSVVTIYATNTLEGKFFPAWLEAGVTWMNVTVINGNIRKVSTWNVMYMVGHLTYIVTIFGHICIRLNMFVYIYIYRHTSLMFHNKK